ncbi:hypothetical protein POL68_20410 [Stigmatella sp. ncwal1]|uniref:Glycosyltransferase RgtA/B/C/D-like domain-containing protein n=1 Tax=Stigmatella ashevillensis TaxID=2995309 RepID=A0ABT5DAY2_9BACT|nr:hypothetical protein [Stigmatella ashevillena]MDC0710850.1 hypothetical protein [Stigmatella ashevillena]
MAVLPLRILRSGRLVAVTASLRLMCFCALALWAAWTPLGQAGGMNDFRDSQVIHSYEEMAVRTVLDYGQVPLWTPWTCGGLYALGSPQTRFASPPFLLSLLVGARRAEPVLLFLFLVVGMEGFFRYARLRSGSALGAFVTAPLFALNGLVAMSWMQGWINFFGFLLLPWCLLGTALVCRRRPGGLVLLAGAFAVMLGFGGTYPVPMSALFVVLEAAGGLLAQRSWTQRSRVAGWLGAAALFTLGASAFRLWPLLETMQSAPRIMAGQPGTSLAGLASTLLGSVRQWDSPFFLAPPILLLAAASVFSRRALLPGVAALLCAWLATGYHFKASLFEALRALPFFETLRYPERFAFFLAFFLAVLGATGLGVLWRRARRSRLAAWGAVVMCWAALVGMGLARQGFDATARRTGIVPEPERVEQPFAQARGNRWSLGYFVALNRGSIACGEAYPVPMSEALRGDLPQEESLEDPSAGTARRAFWSPNRLEWDVHAAHPTFLRINQNWHPGWKSSVGEVVSREGLLSVSLPAGEHHVTLRFLPRSGIGGALVSLLTWVSLGFVVLGSYRQRSLALWKVGGLAAGPLIAWALLAVFWREPSAPPVLTNPNGTPLLVEALPPEARPVRATFGVPVELHGALVPEGPDANGLLSFELFWKVTGNVPRPVGVFVHLVHEHGRMSSVDHEVLGGTYFFKNAPRGPLLRDAFTVSAPTLAPGTWKLLVGLWNTRQGNRISARDTGGLVSDGRVLAGTFTVPPP